MKELPFPTFKRLVFDGVCISLIALNLIVNQRMYENDAFLYFVLVIFETRYIMVFVRDSLRYGSQR